MATPLLIDTDVLIDYLRDYPDAVSYVEAQQERLLISVVTVAELYAGVREGEERSRLERFLRAFEIIPLDQRLAVQGGLYRRDDSKSHHVGLADGLIAATATQRQVPTGDAQPEAFSHAPGRACAVPQGAAQPRAEQRHRADALKRAAHARRLVPAHRKEMTMDSWDVLPHVPLQAVGPVSREFITRGITDFQAAGRTLQGLPYGRTGDRADFRAALREGQGTCSTTHALLAALAHEQGLPVVLTLGIYAMHERNTPGVGGIHNTVWPGVAPKSPLLPDVCGAAY